MDDLAWAKRLLERSADPSFAERLRRDPDAAGAEVGTPWSPRRIQALWEPGAGEGADPVVVAWRERIREQYGLRDRLRDESAVPDPVLGPWRERQVHRCAGELGPARERALLHGPFAVELSRGCSVRCWFCGLAAGPLEATWPYTAENAALWRGMLAALHALLGPAARWGVCYWATEPLDNPEYERFLDDYVACLGVAPQTTTTQALRDPERTRRLLRRARETTPVSTRFSVLTPTLLRRLHETFSPAELLGVELLPQFRGGPVVKARSGRVLEAVPDEHAGTIACVTGFLIRPLEGTVELITPCRACERWPLGYKVLGERSFADAEGFARALHELREGVPTSVRDLPRVRPGRHWRIAPTDEGLSACTENLQLQLRAPGRLGAVHALADLLRAGTHRADTVATLLRYTCGQDEERTLADLDLLFRRGVLEEEP